MATLKSQYVRKKQENKVGADPEVFLFKDGKPFPAIGLIGGTKENPRPISNGAVQEDNVMAEFNIAPSKSAEEFSSNVEKMLGIVRKLAQKHGCELYIQPYAEFQEHYLNHPQAMAIGCDPDYNAWTLQMNPTLDYTVLKNIRTASGHVHVGVPNPEASPMFRSRLIKVLDLYLGVPSILLDPDKIRRKFYGKAGAFRPKPYGVEYRVLSNFWINDDKLRKWVFNNTINAITNIGYYSKAEINGDQYFASIQKCINNNDVALAEKLINKFSIELPY